MTSQPYTRPDAVNDALTLNRPSSAGPSQAPQRGSRRRKRDVENDDFARFAARIIRAYGRRIASGDVEGLGDLLELAVELDCATRTAVEGLREGEYSWAEIASRLGISRQAAQQRWGR